MKRQRKKCPKCGKLISLSNFSKHVDSCDGENKTSLDNFVKNKDGLYNCPHCDKPYSAKGIGTHVWRKHGEGKEHDPNIGFINKMRTAWNKDIVMYDDEFYSDENIIKEYITEYINVHAENTIRRHMKKHLIRKHGHKCSICETENWFGHKIPLVCDHIDGDSTNNNYDNFRLVCGNCDMLLPTYKSRNLGNGRKDRRKN